MAKTCPRCGSRRIGYAIMAGASTYVGHHTANWYACKDCGYTGPIVLEGFPKGVVKNPKLKPRPFFGRWYSILCLAPLVSFFFTLPLAVVLPLLGAPIVMYPLIWLLGIVTFIVVVWWKQRRRELAARRARSR